MSRRNPKPTPTNIRNRLFRIEADAKSGAELAQLWDPKGRDFQARRNLIQALDEIAQRALLLRQSITHAPRPRRLKPVKRDDNYVQRELGKMLGSLLR